jgi:hypothetical protein
MSTIGLAPPWVVDDLLPEVHPYSLLTVGHQLDGRWDAGIGIWAFPSGDGVPSGFDPCAEGTFREKDEVGEAESPLFPSFTAYAAFQCSTMGMGSFQDFQDRVNRVLDAVDVAAIERQLVQGDPIAVNANGDAVPFLGDAHLDILAVAAVGPGPALAYLEDAIGETHRAGVIGASPGVVSAWSFDGGLRVVDGQLRTWLGTPVYVATGFIGADPVSGSTPAAGQGWAFATGPIAYGRSGLIEIGATAAETIDRTLNDVVYRAERDVVVGWDTALQAGILVDWTP